MACKDLSQAQLDAIFPSERTNAFFEALYGDIEEGPYDIRLECAEQGGDKIVLNFDLIKRPGKCLACNFTYGLPQVFARHPVINAGEIARKVADALDWKGELNWKFLPTQEISDDVHKVPFVIELQNSEV